MLYMSFTVLSCNFTYRGAAFFLPNGGGGGGVLSASLEPRRDREGEEAIRRGDI
jgi:hypothetical protein